MTATSPTPSVMSSVTTLERSPAPGARPDVDGTVAPRPPPPLTTRRAKRARRVLAARRRPADRDFRPDIEGLRAIAVVAVVVYHAGLALPGGYVGVDVFLVISGFLITRQLLKTVGRGGLRALPTFYGHRVRRLLPAAVVVVLATTVAFRFVGPPLKVREVATDAVFTAFSGLNYRLAWVGTDYQHMGAAASPLQHFGRSRSRSSSTSSGRSSSRSSRWPPAAGTCGSSSACSSSPSWRASGWASATLTPTNAPWAYFSLHTRAWELGVGALLALAAPRLVALPRRLAGLAAWLGLAAIALAAVRFTDATPFPGTAAWLPVGGAALVVAAGCGPRVGPSGCSPSRSCSASGGSRTRGTSGTGRCSS